MRLSVLSDSIDACLSSQKCRPTLEIRSTFSSSIADQSDIIFCSNQHHRRSEFFRLGVGGGVSSFMHTENDMIPTRSDPTVKPSKCFEFFSFFEKPSDFFVRFVKLGLVLCIVVSLALALQSPFLNKTRWFPMSEKIQSVIACNDGTTNISHVLFGIGASVRTWKDRSRYSEVWWDPTTTRGFAWLDEQPGKNISWSQIPVRVSSDWTRFKFSSSQSAVRIARIVLESFKLGLPNVRWFVMGDDDTVFFTDNLVAVLSNYDHNQMYYIGGDSESVEQDVMHSYGMAFGGGGFAISYPLAAQLVNILDGCLNRYFTFYGSDQKIWACLAEIGVSLTKHRGFHQLDIRGDPYGLLAAHPLAPLVSLHHLEYLEPIFPNQTHIDSVRSLYNGYLADPSRILQQSFCYDRKRKWSVSISWGYTVQIYPFMAPAKDLQTPLRTFKTWRSWSDGPFTFNTRALSPDLCQRPLVYFLEQVQEVGKHSSRTSYRRFLGKEWKECGNPDYSPARMPKTVTVSTMKMNTKQKGLRRQCCKILNHGSIKNSNLQIRIRQCGEKETVTI